jgi:hypothetical protein
MLPAWAWTTARTACHQAGAWPTSDAEISALDGRLRTEEKAAISAIAARHMLTGS